MRAFIRDHRTLAVSEWSAAVMLGEKRHPLLAQMPAPAASAPPHAHRQHIVGVPSAGVPGVGVKLMQEPGFAANDSHLYARDLQLSLRYRDEAARPQEAFLAQGLGTPSGLRYPPGGVPLAQAAAEEDPRRQRALSPGSQHSAAATFFARFVLLPLSSPPL
ncbi:uncharacterized protein [Cherax quadricarinatus]